MRHTKRKHSYVPGEMNGQSADRELLKRSDLFKLATEFASGMGYGHKLNKRCFATHPNLLLLYLHVDILSSFGLKRNIHLPQIFANKMFSFLSSFMGHFATIIRNISHKEEELGTSDCERSDDGWRSSN
jgi:hypothetical protein